MCRFLQLNCVCLFCSLCFVQCSLPPTTSPSIHSPGRSDTMVSNRSRKQCVCCGFELIERIGMMYITVGYAGNSKHKRENGWVLQVIEQHWHLFEDLLLIWIVNSVCLFSIVTWRLVPANVASSLSLSVCSPSRSSAVGNFLRSCRVDRADCSFTIVS